MTGKQDQTIKFIPTVCFVTGECELEDKIDTGHIPTLSLGWGVPSLYYVKLLLELELWKEFDRTF